MAASSDHETLRQANDRFYRALENLDIEDMEGLWLHSGWVRCVHPGWDAVVGWEAVRQSWEQIFGNTRWMRITATGVDVAAWGDVGVVACAENITAAREEEEVGMAVAQATNLYRRTPEGWRMIHHHSSPAPVHVTEPFSGKVQ
jgi:ketosteroid isomerase-like protein